MSGTFSSLTQGLQRAMQLDFFGDLLGLRSAPVSPGAPESPDKAPTPPTAPVGRLRKLLIQDEVLEYELRRSSRRSIGFLIADEGLRITAPRWVTVAQVEQAIAEKQQWIFAKLREQQERVARRSQTAMRWEDGTRLPYLGGYLTLRVVPGRRVTLSHDAAQASLIISLPPDASVQQLRDQMRDQIRDKVQSWLKHEARRVFLLRLPVFAEKLGVHYQSMHLSSANTRWGSCTSQGKIRLNWRLIHFSTEVIDYVVAHELSHLREMNHSPKFWATVESVLPDYERAKRQLRAHAAADLPRF